jgi:outer membrane lipoprotein-sorting protein
VPSEIHAAAGQDFEATVQYREPEIATGLDAERFELRVPNGANVQRFR